MQMNITGLRNAYKSIISCSLINYFLILSTKVNKVNNVVLITFKCADKLRAW